MHNLTYSLTHIHTHTHEREREREREMLERHINTMEKHKTIQTNIKIRGATRVPPWNDQ